MSENVIDDKVKIFDDQIAYRIPLVCANKAIYDAKITRLSDGEVLYNSVDLGKKINMVIVKIKHTLRNDFCISRGTFLVYPHTT